LACAKVVGLLTTSHKPLVLPIANGQFENNQVVLNTPVVLAPMAGITNSAFRTLCREQGAGLFVSEMVTARALIGKTSRDDAIDYTRQR
jgi:hypothetical protein